MKAALLLLLFCLAGADDLRMEFERFKSQVEGQNADMASRLSASETKMEELVEELQKHKAANNNLTLEMTQLKSEVKRLNFKTLGCRIAGWMKFGDSCYSYIATNEGKTWQQSREYCQNQGADLVVIKSTDEQDFVDRYIGRDNATWLGLTDRETEGVYKWVDGTPLTTPTYWRSREPDGGGREDCALGYNGGWINAPCGEKSYWICEMVF